MAATTTIKAKAPPPIIPSRADLPALQERMAEFIRHAMKPENERTVKEEGIMRCTQEILTASYRLGFRHGKWEQQDKQLARQAVLQHAEVFLTDQEIMDALNGDAGLTGSSSSTGPTDVAAFMMASRPDAPIGFSPVPGPPPSVPVTQATDSVPPSSATEEAHLRSRSDVGC